MCSDRIASVLLGKTKKDVLNSVTKGDNSNDHANIPNHIGMKNYELATRNTVMTLIDV